MKDSDKSNLIYMFRLAYYNAETRYWTGNGWSTDPDQAARMVYDSITEVLQRLSLLNPDGFYRIEFLGKYTA